MDTKTNKHKIALFTDLQEDISCLLKSAISLAHMINGEIEVFTVTKPTAVMEKENQLSAMRSLNREYMLANKRMKDILSPIIKNYGVPVNYSSTFGNIRNEIDRYLHENNPDVIVLGRHKSKHFNTAENRTINFVLSVFKGTVLIVPHDKGLEPGMKIGIGSINCSETLFNGPFTEELFLHAKGAMKSFNIVESSNDLPQTENSLGLKTIQYVFDQNENTVNNLPVYLSKSNIDLLFLDGVNKEKENLSRLLNIYDMVRKSDINLLVTGEKHTHYSFNTTLKIA
ncbi:universal stress protein [Arenibacter sp. ARW7G5Y1]|uniref:universal stress protein n=1 Tax=Arenibacter sp. ARW7G5Y1 TaxID=2135619 RepID=UPI000D756907|nr:universal stress protein [Arenibacter sp. ARW7G5Y1]PXX31412.1 nucleotide-binding universal stress UspA family protein [Arenibacter sp. ARW7G5Y1]